MEKKFEYVKQLFDTPPQYYSTIGTTLKIDSTTIVGLTSYGDIGGSPNRLQTTTLTDSQHTYIQGVQDQEDWECGINYNAADATALWALNNESPKTNHTVEISFSDGEKFTNTAQISFRKDGKGIDEVQTGTLTLTLAGAWTRVAPTP